MPVHGQLRVEGLVNGPFQENCYVLGDSSTNTGAIVDPGDEEQRILAWVATLGFKLDKIINTHAHIDHVGAVSAVKQAHSIPFYLHAAEQPILMAVPLMAAAYGFGDREIPDVDRGLKEGDRIAVGTREATVLETPGHSPGGVCFYFADDKVLIVGDTLFAGSIGRTDIPGGDTATLMRSIREQLLPLPDDVVVYPGHGPATTIGRERRANPFLQQY